MWIYFYPDADSVFWNVSGACAHVIWLGVEAEANFTEYFFEYFNTFLVCLTIISYCQNKITIVSFSAAIWKSKKTTTTTDRGPIRWSLMIRLINYTALACSSVIFLQLVKLAWALATTSHSARGSEHVSMPTVSWPTGWNHRRQRSFKQACDDRTLAQVSLTKKGFWCSGQFPPFSQAQRVVIPNNPYHMSLLIANVDVLRPDRRQWVYTSNA